MLSNKPVLAFCILLVPFFMDGCAHKKKWAFQYSAPIEGVGHPISMVVENGKWWVSDAGHNEILLMDTLGQIIKKYPGFERPMHLATQDGKIYIPEYLTDSVMIVQQGMVHPYTLKVQPDAPAGVAIGNNVFVLADFYNHRIIIQQNNMARTLGTEGHEAGEFYYPTDVALFRDTLYVADAYNNRVQVFDEHGKHITTIGEKDHLNIASGLDVDNKFIAVTDQGNNRVLLYDHQGILLQTLSEHIDYPTDVYFDRQHLYITNFYKGTIAVYRQQ